MASLGDTSRGESGTSNAKFQATSPSDTTKSRSLDNQDRNNKPTKYSFNTTTEIQDSQSDNEQPNNDVSSLKPIHEVRTIIQNDFIESLVRTGKDSFDRHLRLQRTSPFWSKLFNPPPEDANSSYRPPPLVSREWAEYVVDASRIFFEAGLSVKKVVAIINRAIRFAAICLLNRGTEKIYFEDGRNVFYEFTSRGMPKELKAKYKAFLKGMRDSILEGREGAQSDSEMEMEVKSESSDESSSDASEASQLEDTVITPVEDAEMTTDTLPWELSTTPTEVKPSTLNTVENSDTHAQTTQNALQTNKERNRKRQNLKRKERKKRSLARLRAQLLSQSKDTTKSKAEKRKRWRQNRKKKEKTKKRNAAARQATAV
ncbi:hypothetical protein EIK77_006784 [Talaromyces pinophilus]|nr:hypothetical protein EIK77_006784 [Talaromyces pinophilus]PCH05937.1 Hypothetical protein PENO1_020030 [Penicillium occitanis (nom. inval.)]PCH06929.1 hypothetical protein PENOC_021700 [Penicillium occitanis (nom. inval.)]